MSIAVCALAAPQEAFQVPLLQRTEVRDEAGQYALSYLTADGIAFAEQGALKQSPDGTSNVLVVQGSYSYQSPDGKIYKVKYIADENGFRPEGDHFPVAPEVPVV